MDPHKQAILHGSADCLWRTPPEGFAALARIFPFDIDLAATAENCCVTREEMNEDLNGKDLLNLYLGPDHPVKEYRDALQVAWHQMGKVGFLNPSYSLTRYSEGLKAGVSREELQWLLIESWARKAYEESLLGFTTVGWFPYAPQTEWFRSYVMGHGASGAGGSIGWAGHAALDYWRIPYRVSFLRADGSGAANANVNSCIVQWGPNPGFVGPWVPSGRYWSYR